MIPLHEQTVTAVLENALDQFEAEHARYWSEQLPKSEIARYMTEFGPPEDWYSVLRKMGQDALHLVERLTGEGFSENYELQQAIEPSPIYLGLPLVALQTQAAREFTSRLEEMARRASQVIELAWEVGVSQVVARYARLLGRCYLAGFDGECVILCRSVLDAALKDALNERGEGAGNMKDRIDKAVEIGLLHRTLVGEAHCIRLRGKQGCA